MLSRKSCFIALRLPKMFSSFLSIIECRNVVSRFPLPMRIMFAAYAASSIHIRKVSGRPHASMQTSNPRPSVNSSVNFAMSSVAVLTTPSAPYDMARSRRLFSTSATAIFPANCFAARSANSPIGPAPTMRTLSVWCITALDIAWREMENGSISASSCAVSPIPGYIRSIGILMYSQNAPSR